MRGTLVILMGLKNLPAIVAELRRHGRAAGTPAAVVAEGTTAAQRTVRTTLGELVAQVAAHAIRPPAVVVVGAVVTALAEPASETS
jgi:uroporphyrin-III C-methyltransferase/precorrin-2 dehydrogenase/sirohydrochlorin ferrochelatase